MKTDFEILKEAFDAIGCKYTTSTAQEEAGTETVTIVEYSDGVQYSESIKLDEGIGYPYFTCEFYFLKGKFQAHGCWE